MACPGGRFWSSCREKKGIEANDVHPIFPNRFAWIRFERMVGEFIYKYRMDGRTVNNGPGKCITFPVNGRPANGCQRSRAWCYRIMYGPGHSINHFGICLSIQIVLKIRRKGSIGPFRAESRPIWALDYSDYFVFAKKAM